MSLTGADTQYIYICWHWATQKDAKAAGLDLSSLHAVKFQRQGQRYVLMCPFGPLQNVCKGTVGAGGCLAIAKTADTFAEADQNMVEARIKAKVPLMQCVVPEGTGLFVPWGWITAEKRGLRSMGIVLDGDELRLVIRRSNMLSNFPMSRFQKIPRVSNPTAQRLFSPKFPMHCTSPSAALLQLLRHWR